MLWLSQTDPMYISNIWSLCEVDNIVLYEVSDISLWPRLPIEPWLMWLRIQFKPYISISPTMCVCMQNSVMIGLVFKVRKRNKFVFAYILLVRITLADWGEKKRMEQNNLNFFHKSIIWNKNFIFICYT